MGDAAASVVGSKYGRNKFPDSDKSVEGTLGSVVAQLLFVWVLQRWGMVAEDQDWTLLYLPVVTVALVEALTVQVDNLILPLVMYSFL